MLWVGSTAFVGSLLVSWLLCGAMIRWAPLLGLVDNPAGRKQHRRPTPLGGGVGIFLGVALPLAGVWLLAGMVRSFPSVKAYLPEVVGIHSAGVWAQGPLLAAIVLAAAVQTIVGLIDDRFRLGFQVRLVVEVLLVLVLIAGGVELAYPPGWRIVTIPLTVLWIVGLTNAMNFLDNMDGLSAGVASIASVFFAVICFLVGDLFVGGCYVILLGSLLGFLHFNWSPARLFMGDAGSNFVGFWLGTLTVISTFKTEAFSHVTLLAPLCVLAVPIYDSMTVTLVRMRQGRSPFMPDRQHLSHRLVELGFPSTRAVLIIYLVSVATGLSGLLLYFVPASAAWIVLLQLLASLAILAVLELGRWGSRESE
jgi:UDP-GlcNAc:undecaprenyl-phosphate GlcNAc-1-phosphate transferase